MSGTVTSYPLPMFPLGSVLFPHMVLPLHVFEPRYQAMMQEVMAGHREFGVALIERGHEVGGGDTRSMSGTVASIVDAEEQEDGRWLVVAVGDRRVRVDQWHEDDPFPWADVTDVEDEPGADEGELVALRAEVAPRLRRVLALGSELGHDLPDGELDADPVVASYQACILAPLTPFDGQRLLDAPTVADRYRMLCEELDGLAQLLEYRLAAGQDD